MLGISNALFALPPESREESNELFAWRSSTWVTFPAFRRDDVSQFPVYNYDPTEPANALQPPTRMERCANEPFPKANCRIDPGLFRHLQTGTKTCDHSSERHGCVAGHGDRTRS